jgi:hypothetical protein
VTARSCQCAGPQYAIGETTCRRCGQPVSVKVTPSTWRIALAIAEIALGRRLEGRGGSRDEREDEAA